MANSRTSETYVVTDDDFVACWPQQWRDDFAEQNRLLAETGDESLTPTEYLQCRADDCEEHAWYVRRERMLQELLLAIIDTAGTLTLAERFVKAARAVRKFK